MNRMITECPDCGAKVVMRLGSWECTRCDYTAEAAPADANPQLGEPQSYKDPRSDRHNLGDLLSGVVRLKGGVPRASRGRRR